MVGKIVIGVALGILLAALVLWVVVSFATQPDSEDVSACIRDNADRAMTGQPEVDCYE